MKSEATSDSFLAKQKVFVDLRKLCYSYLTAKAARE